MGSNFKISAHLDTHVGMVRDHNEDFVASEVSADMPTRQQNGDLFIVADGVGGEASGEIASQFATEQTIKNYLDDDDKNWARRLRHAMLMANNQLRKKIDKEHDGKAMATTMVSAVIHNKTATIANVGDSRAYILRNGKLIQLTKDQSLVAQLLEEGAITAEEAETHPRRNVILYSLGPEPDPRIDTYQVDLQHNDALILCSDGLIRHVADDEIATIIDDYDPQEATETLISLANERGGTDNISVGIIRLHTETDSTDPTQPDTQLRTETTQNEKPNLKNLWLLTVILLLAQILLIYLALQ